MNQGALNPDALMAKAAQASASARALLELGDADGAANRAYYAMFDAARAALLARGALPETGRTHRGLIGTFGRFVLENRPDIKEMGRFLNRAHETRLLADYTGDGVDREEAQKLVEQAAAFVAAMRDGFVRGDVAAA